MKIKPSIIRNLDSQQSYKVQEICIDNDVDIDCGEWMPIHTDDPVIIIFNFGNSVRLTTSDDNNLQVEDEESTELTFKEFMDLYDI